MSVLRAVRTLGRPRSSRSVWYTAAAVSYNAMPKNRCFSSKGPNHNDNDNELAQWIPPDRPLVGDKGSSHLYNRRGGHEDDAQGHNNAEEEEATFSELDQEEELRKLELELQQRLEEDEKQKSHLSNTQEPVDWLQTRRSKLQWDGVEMMTPDLARTKKFQASDVAVIRHTLLTRDEITLCLTAMGGTNITFLPNTLDRRMGAATGMILTTGSTPSQIFLLADTLVRQLKRRNLADVGVVGAQFGAEGSADKTDTWRVVDCYNYIVHILDANTRRHLNLEALWSGNNDASLRVRLDDETAMDDYVAANPVPEGYSPNATQDADWSSSMSQMERNRWIVPHRPVIPRPKGRKRRRGRR